MEPMLTDLKALLVERDECNAGTVQKIREGLSQAKSQYKSLREVTDLLRNKAESASGAQAKMWHLKLGVASFFLGDLDDAVENLKQSDGPLAYFFLGRVLIDRKELDEAAKAFDRAEKAGYTASQVKLQRAGIARMKGDLAQARKMLNTLEDQASHNAEYHYQLACCYLEDSDRSNVVRHLERAVELDPGHSGALFQLGHANDSAGNDEDAINYYERCLAHPPVHVGVMMNLGILYEDNDHYDKALNCFQKIVNDDPQNETAKLFAKDAEASLRMYYNPDEDSANNRFSQVLEVPVTDFELSVRSRNCLKKMNIKTLGDLTRISEQQLLSSKNFGETSLTEIKEILGSRGLRLGQSLEEGAPVERRYSLHHQPLSEQDQALLNKPVGELNLSVRARKCMNRLGIASIGELIIRSADELLESKNFGMTSLTEVREKLRLIGLTLRGD